MTNDDDWRRANHYLNYSDAVRMGFTHDDVHEVADMLSTVREEAFEQGMAVGAALVAWAEELASNGSIEACRDCGNASGGRIYDMPPHRRPGYQCIDCNNLDDVRKGLRAHPYR